MKVIESFDAVLREEMKREGEREDEDLANTWIAHITIWRNRIYYNIYPKIAAVSYDIFSPFTNSALKEARIQLCVYLWCNICVFTLHYVFIPELKWHFSLTQQYIQIIWAYLSRVKNKMEFIWTLNEGKKMCGSAKFFWMKEGSIFE